MPPRITNVQRQAVLGMLVQGMDRGTIAYQVGVTPGQVSAVAAHVKMGTYKVPDVAERPSDPSSPSLAARGNGVADLAKASADDAIQPSRLIDRLPHQASPATTGQLSPVFLGTDAETGEEVNWNPDPQTGTANPHVLVLGESGFGKTYTISALLTELARQHVVSIVFDYGQGFSTDVAPKEFIDLARPIEIHASQDGIAINPLQIFPSDLHGPLEHLQSSCSVYPQ